MFSIWKDMFSGQYIPYCYNSLTVSSVASLLKLTIEFNCFLFLGGWFKKCRMFQRRNISSSLNGFEVIFLKRLTVESSSSFLSTFFILCLFFLYPFTPNSPGFPDLACQIDEGGRCAPDAAGVWLLGLNLSQCLIDNGSFSPPSKVFIHTDEHIRSGRCEEQWKEWESDEESSSLSFPNWIIGWPQGRTQRKMRKKHEIFSWQ